MAIEVFNRYENKYLIDEVTFNKIKEDLKNYMSFDKYNKDETIYSIYNIYLDTTDDNYIRTSISKPIYKEKVRIRSYNDFNNSEFVYLEIKRKFDGQGNKRRTKIKLDEALEFIKTGIKPIYQDYMNNQVIDELAYIFNKNELYLKTLITYDRIAYFNNDEHDLRITFDTNIISQRSGQENCLLDKRMWLMEIKAQKSYPVWITKLLSKYEIKKTSFSKYGKDYEKALVEMIMQNKEVNKTYNSSFDLMQKKMEDSQYGINFKHEYC